MTPAHKAALAKADLAFNRHPGELACAVEAACLAYAAALAVMDRQSVFKEAYMAACAAMDADKNNDVEPMGILDDVMAVLAKLAGVP